MPDEISRDEDVSKVVRPRFRMGLKPTALLRHAAKVRLAWRLAQNDTGRVFAKYFPFFTPLSHGKPCQLSHKESLRSRSPCYSRWQRGKRCKGSATKAGVLLPPSGREGDRLRWKENAEGKEAKMQRRSGFYIRRLPPLILASPFAWSKCALGIASLHFSLLGGVSRHKNTALWCFCLLTSRRGAT